MIEFLCPQGHKIRWSKDKAGRPAKCPKCGVGFRVPTIEELGLAESAAADSSPGGEVVTDVPAAAPSPGLSGKQSAISAGQAKERQIEFLCPNGHHLHGPASLQGRAGECPECGSRFRIPVIEKTEANPVAGAKAPGEEEITLEFPSLGSGAEHAPASSPSSFSQHLDDGGSVAKLPGLSGDLGGALLDLASSPNGAVHPLASLFIELWAARGEGSRVEVHLESGSVLLPDGYLKSRSQQDYAVLVTREPDGCSTITVVPWNSISRIIMRAIKQVPGEVVR